MQQSSLNWSKTEMNTNAAILISWPLFRMHLCKAATTSWPTWKYTFFAMECYFQYIRNVDVARVSMLPPTNFVCITQVWAIANDIQKGKQASSQLCQGQDAQKYAYELLEATKGPGRRRHNQKLISRQFPSFHIKQRNLRTAGIITASTTLKPLVQFSKVPELSAVCCTGNEKVKPISRDWPATGRNPSPSLATKLESSFAIKSNSSSLVPIMTSRGIATSSYSCLITLPCFPPNWTRSTRKLVPPRSTA